MVESIGELHSRHNIETSNPLWENSIHEKVYGDADELADAWRQGKIIMVSDISAKDDIATGAWVRQAKTYSVKVYTSKVLWQAQDQFLAMIPIAQNVLVF